MVTPDFDDLKEEEIFWTLPFIAPMGLVRKILEVQGHDEVVDAIDDLVGLAGGVISRASLAGAGAVGRRIAGTLVRALASYKRLSDFVEDWRYARLVLPLQARLVAEEVLWQLGFQGLVSGFRTLGATWRPRRQDIRRHENIKREIRRSPAGTFGVLRDASEGEYVPYKSGGKGL